MGIIKDIMEKRKVKKLVAVVENENAEDEARKKLNEILEEYPSLRTEALSYAKESEQIEDDVIVETLTENIETLVNKEKISEEERDLLQVGVNFMGNIGDNVPDQYLNKVANAAGNSKHIDRKKEIGLVKKIESKEDKQAQVAKILKRIYLKTDAKKTENEIVYELKQLREVVEPCKSINDWERKIVAKKIAYNYMNYGSSKLTTVAEIIPINKMLQINMPQVVENEYADIFKRNKENNEKRKVYKYDKQNFRLNILNELARICAYKYYQTGEIIVPQSEQMRKISLDEEEFFIDKIKKLASVDGKMLTDKQVDMIRGGIRGEIEEIIDLEQITHIINSKPLEERILLIKQIKEIVADNKKSKLFEMLKDSELDKSFAEMEEKDIKSSLKIFKQTLDEQKQKRVNIIDDKKELTEKEAEDDLQL